MRGDELEGPRHPQSTKPMKRGRPLFRAGFRTRAEFLEAVAERRARGYTVAHLAKVFGVAWYTAQRAVIDAEALIPDTEKTL